MMLAIFLSMVAALGLAPSCARPSPPRLRRVCAWLTVWLFLWGGLQHTRNAARIPWIDTNLVLPGAVFA